jgi:hypothetical protein
LRHLGCRWLGLRAWRRRKRFLRRLAAGVAKNEESNKTYGGSRSNGDRQQPGFARSLFLGDGRADDSRCRGIGAGVRFGRGAFGRGIRPEGPLRGLLGRIGLHFPAHPLARVTWVERGQASIEAVDLAQWVRVKRHMAFLVEELEQFQFSRVQAALDRIDRALRCLSDVADAQLAFELQQEGFALVAGQLPDGSS